jgi:hypothetical protein
MDQSMYRNYLDDGITGRERLLPVPIAPAPMRRTIWSYFPRVTLPEIPTEALVASAKREGFYALRFIACSPILLAVFGLIIALGIARYLMIYVMAFFGFAAALMTIFMALVMFSTKVRYPNTEMVIAASLGSLVLTYCVSFLCQKIIDWLPETIRWTKL